jgi:uncharacterized protein (TIGR02147 family)
MMQDSKIAIKRSSLEIQASQFIDYKDYLKSLYLRTKQGIDGYSYLKFAVDLGFSETNVIHLVIQGKRPLSEKASHKIIENLDLKKIQASYFKALVKYQNSRISSERQVLFEELLALKNRCLPGQLEKSQMEYFGEWYHPVIRELVGLEDFQSNAEWIAGKLFPRIRPEQARKSLELLENLNLIRFDAGLNKHIQLTENITTADEVSSMAVIHYLIQTIDIGKESITSVDEFKRDVSAVALSISSESVNIIKQEIQEFRRKILALADESIKKDRIYQLNLQFFPFTKDEE